MDKGIGFGPEGDYKIAAFGAVLMEMAKGREGATGFIEDYTYDLTEGQELELASICWRFRWHSRLPSPRLT